MIILENITKKYKKGNKNLNILNDISVEFEYGKFYAIVGKSGSGKTTLLQLIGLLDVPTTGKIKIDNYNLSKFSDEKTRTLIRRNKIGYIFQDFYLNEDLTVRENIMIPLYAYNKPIRKEQFDNINELLRAFNLDNRENHFPRELSGGEKQRVSIARSIISNPKIILADEPTGNLDKTNENEVFRLLRKFAKQGRCVIVVSHSENIMKYADIVLRIDAGALLYE